MSLHPQIAPGTETSVTHFLCPKGPTEGGKPVASHHLRPRSAGRVGGQPTYQQVCEYCGQTEAELRAQLLPNG